MKMGPEVYYGPDGAPAGASDGSVGPAGQPESTNAATGTAELAKWQAQLPKDLRGNEAFSGINDLGTLGSNYIRMTTELAELKAAKQSEPTETVTAKAEPVKYENFGARLGENLDADGSISTGIADVLQGRNMPQKDAEKLMEDIAKEFQKGLEKLQKDGPSMTDQYNRKRWDKDYDANKALATRSEHAVFGDDAEFQQKVERSGIKSFPEYWDIMCQVGQLIAEDRGAPYSSQGKLYNGVPIDYSKPSL